MATRTRLASWPTWLLLSWVVWSGAGRTEVHQGAGPQSLEGQWDVVSIERNGNLITRPEAIKGMRLTFTGQTVVIAGLFGKQELRCRFSTNDATAPKQLDWTCPDGRQDQMLYEFRDKDLRIAFAFADSKERPRVISGAAGSRAIVMTLRRSASGLP